jgi:hypothetical protein
MGGALPSSRGPGPRTTGARAPDSECATSPCHSSHALLARQATAGAALECMCALCVGHRARQGPRVAVLPPAARECPAVRLQVLYGQRTAERPCQRRIVLLGVPPACHDDLCNLPAKGALPDGPHPWYLPQRFLPAGLPCSAACMRLQNWRGHALQGDIRTQVMQQACTHAVVIGTCPQSMLV